LWVIEGFDAVASVRILLTFDDGPHAGALNGDNRTEKVMAALRSKDITAVFFIQTHVPYRLPSPNGYRIACRMHAEGHVLAIHTGSFADHRCHKWRCTQPPDVAGTTNGLDSDMLRARAAIKAIVGIEPKFVRATFGYTNADCMQVYSRNKLKHVYWDIISGDDLKGASRTSVQTQLAIETTRLASGACELIYLLHDINQVTSERLIDFIETIEASVHMTGHTPVFISDANEAEIIMERRSMEGTDWPCPADSMG
jgi:peptidoglycan/xylan/chitin deacetylase (PgdA/CDA1 family)